MGLLDLEVFFPLIYLSPGAGLSISSGQTDWHIISIIALSLSKESPASFVKVFGGVRIFNHLPTFLFFFFSLKRERKNNAQHTILSQTVQIKTPKVLERCLVIRFPLESLGV